MNALIDLIEALTRDGTLSLRSEHRTHSCGTGTISLRGPDREEIEIMMCLPLEAVIRVSEAHRAAKAEF